MTHLAKVKMVVWDSLSSEKIKFLKALNVELLIVGRTLPPESPDSYNNIKQIVPSPLLTTEVGRKIFPVSTPVYYLGERGCFLPSLFQAYPLMDVIFCILACFMNHHPCGGRDIPTTSSGAHHLLSSFFSLC